MKIALYQPDIPQNTASFVRLTACLGIELHIIEPCGFIWDEKKLARVAMDYLPLAHITRHRSIEAFKDALVGSRLLLLTTKSSTPYTRIAYQPGDILLCGRESSGVPQEIHDMADQSITIPMAGQARSLNVVNAASMVAGEMLRQTIWTI